MDVYKITNRVNGKCYVGTTIRTTESRFREHCNNALLGKRVAPLYDAMREHGLSSFEVETISTTALYEELLSLERAAIASEGCVVPNGYNVVRGGRGNFGWKMSDATKARISARAKGRVAHNKGKRATPEQRANTSAVQRARFERERKLGIVHTAWNKGVPATDETRKKLSDMRRGKPLSVAHRMSFTGLKRSPESRALFSLRKREWWASLTPEERHHQIEIRNRGHAGRGRVEQPTLF